MIKLSAYNAKTKTDMIVLGLSDGNLNRLRQGHPIHILGKEWDKSFDLMIFWGPTEEAMAKMVEPFIGPDTRVEDHSKEKKQ
jgi:hypothetical protein